MINTISELITEYNVSFGLTSSVLLKNPIVLCFYLTHCIIKISSNITLSCVFKIFSLMQ